MTELRLPTLETVVNGYSPVAAGKGLCFHMAVALALDLLPDPGTPEPEVVIGTLRGATELEAKVHPEYSTEPFIHCWVEWEGAVLAPTTLDKTDGKLIPFHREDYYRKNGIRDTRRIGRARLFELERGINVKMRCGIPLSRPLGDILLEEAGIAWRLSDQGGVIPA